MKPNPYHKLDEDDKYETNKDKKNIINKSLDNKDDKKNKVGYKTE